MARMEELFHGVRGFHEDRRAVGENKICVRTAEHRNSQRATSLALRQVCSTIVLLVALEGVRGEVIMG